MRQVGERRAHDAAEIDAVMVVEVVIFVRDDGLLHDERDARERHLDAVLFVDRGQQRAVAREDARRARGLIVGHAADVGQVARVGGDDAGDRGPPRRRAIDERNAISAPRSQPFAWPSGGLRLRRFLRDSIQYAVDEAAGIFG